MYIKIQNNPVTQQHLSVELYMITVGPEQKDNTNQGRLTGMQDA